MGLECPNRQRRHATTSSLSTPVAVQACRSFCETVASPTKAIAGEAWSGAAFQKMCAARFAATGCRLGSRIACHRRRRAEQRRGATGDVGSGVSGPSGFQIKPEHWRRPLAHHEPAQRCGLGPRQHPNAAMSAAASSCATSPAEYAARFLGIIPARHLTARPVRHGAHVYHGAREGLGSGSHIWRVAVDCAPQCRL